MCGPRARLGMPLVVDQLQLWTIGFRWAGCDPGRPRLLIPVSVRDNFSTLLEAILKDQLVCETLDHKKWNGVDPQIAPFHIRHWLDDINAAIRGERFSRKLLNHSVIERFQFKDWCERCSIPLPEFWFPAGWTDYRWPFEDDDDGQAETGRQAKPHPHVPGSEHPVESVSAPDEDEADSSSAASEAEPRPSQKARIACQVIAASIWKLEPDKTIADMCRDERILKLGDAMRYEERTVRRWIQEVAPAHVSARRGRPPRKNPSEE